MHMRMRSTLLDLLGPHAMDDSHLCQLLEVAQVSHPSAPLVILRHESSLTAEDKQRLLPQGIYVQKTVTLRLATHILLVSGLGDFRLTRDHYRLLASKLHLSTADAKKHEINPSWISPWVATGLQEGMVSPFIPPGFSPAQITAIALLVPPPSIARNALVGISLSLSDSLLFPVLHLSGFIFTYYARYHPSIPILELPLIPSD